VPKATSIVSKGIDSDDEQDTPADAEPPRPPVATHERFLSLAAYVTFLPALAFVVLKKYQRNKFLRFHSWQSIFFWALVIALVGLGLLASTFGFLLLWLVTGILVAAAIGLTWLVLAIKALQGEWFQLPGLGSLAEQIAGS
jgi:uncharacterized membrane protein